MFANPLALLALLAVPAIVALHLFRRRFRPRTVSALFLWEEEHSTPMSGRQREPLRASASLVLECLAAIALALLLAAPKGCAAEGGEHLVVVLDGSASMEARDRHGESARDRAVKLVRERIASLPRGSRVTLIASGPRPRTLAGPAAFPDEAGEALDRFAPSLVDHDLEPALALAAQIAGGAAVLCVTDRYAPDAIPPDVEIAAVGRPLDNVAIARATREAVHAAGESGGAKRERIVAIVANFGAASARRELRVHGAGGAEIAEPVAIELEPGARRELAFSIAADAGEIELVLVADPPGSDALACDDHVYLAPRPPRVVRVFSTLSDDATRALGLGSADSNLARLIALAEDVAVADSAQNAHLVLGADPKGGPASWTFAIGARGTERKDWVGPFLFDRRHPLLDGVTLDGVVWSAGTGAGLVGVPLVTAGSVPLAVESAGGATRAFVLDLDPLRSTLARSPDWPILLANLVEMRRRELPGPLRANVALGEPLVYRAALEGPSDAPFALVGTSERREHPPRDTAIFEDVATASFWRLERSGVHLATFGVSFVDERESDLRALGSGIRAASLARARSEPAASPLATALLAALFAFVLADWLVLRRGGAVFAAGSARP